MRLRKKLRITGLFLAAFFTGCVAASAWSQWPAHSAGLFQDQAGGTHLQLLLRDHSFSLPDYLLKHGAWALLSGALFVLLSRNLIALPSSNVRTRLRPNVERKVLPAAESG